MRAVAFAAFVLSYLPAIAGAQPCPPNGFSMGGPGYFEDSSTAPTFNWFGISYNHVTGTLGGGHSGSGEAGSFASLTSQDRYTIVGPPSGSPIPFQARVHFTGTAGGGEVLLPNLGSVCRGSQVAIRLAEGILVDDRTIPSEPCEPKAFDETLVLDLVKLPGEEFTLATSLYQSAGHSIQTSASGALTFAGLPSGYSVQSCQGYAVAPVAVRARSWGQVKQLYR